MRRPPAGAGQGDRRLDAALDAYLADQGWGELSRLATIERVWTEVAGAEVAAHVRPLRVLGPTLVVGVDRAIWASQLNFLAPQLLERLAAQLGESAPKRLETTVRHR